MSRAGRSVWRLVRAASLWAGIGIGASSCRGKAESAPGVERAEFGVLFGGDVQDRQVIPLELDIRRQELGLRITFHGPLQHDVKVSWEIEKPTSERGADGGFLYAAELGERRARAGERRFESRFAFRRTDRPGSWRVRMRVDGRLVHERRFEVVAPRRSEAE